MIPDDSLGIYVAILFFCFAKFLYYIVNIFGDSMYRKQNLSIIPEKVETEEEVRSRKWVPKKKHEVLKAKYKCLKKLFQIYDASVIGILPESYDQADDDITPEEESRKERRHSRRKKRSYRTKTDACAATSELSSGDVSIRTDEKDEIASAVIRDLKIHSCSTQMMTEDCQEKCETSEHNHPVGTDHYERTPMPPHLDCQQPGLVPSEMLNSSPYLIYNERKPTRFQSFMQRLFGIRPEKLRGGVSSHIYAASDNNITYNYCEKRRRRGLRFRRLKRTKKARSEMTLRDVSSPTILNYVQTIQKSCLMDRTPRQCPIQGCTSLFYGIINYNDHLNLCHFLERKFMCLYCHEGFEVEYEKYMHENDHLGVNKLKPNLQNMSPSSTRQSQKCSNTQTEPDIKSEVPEEKLKKIVSFFDKIVDADQMLAQLNQNRYSESNIHNTEQCKTESEPATVSDTVMGSDKRTLSCGNLMYRKDKSKCNQSDVTSKYHVKCHLCGEDFDYRRQLYLHVDSEHGRCEKPSKYHSCAGIAHYRGQHNGLMKCAAGKINVQTSRGQSSSSMTQDDSSMDTREKSHASLSCDPSTNIIYYESLDSIKKPSVHKSFTKVRSGITNYRWEPGTKIIRV